MASLAYPIHAQISSPQQAPRHRSIPKAISSIAPSAITAKRAAASILRATDASIPKSDFDLSSLLGKQEERADLLNYVPVLDTPRRGRRVGKVDLGWDFTLATANEEQKQHKLSQSVSPRKRKLKDSGLNYTSSANVRLVESQGRASAAIAKLPTSQSLNILEAFSTSPNTAESPFQPSPTRAPTYDKLAGFVKEEDALSLPVLVPVEVPMMGRMAVNRSEASKIACMDTSILFQSTSGSSVGGTSSSTKQTSTFDDYSLDPSPSFSLSSHFPVSEPNSPTKAFSREDVKSSLYKSSPEKNLKERIQTIRDAHLKPKVEEDLETTHSSWKPRLEGPGMPLLNWPDSPNGPWSGAGKEVRRLQEQKRRGIARWLEEDSEDEPTGGLADDHQHPMIAKAMHDRARKEMLIRSLSMSHLKMSKHMTPVKKSSSSSRRRKIKSEGSSKSRGLSQKAVYLHPPPKAIGRLADFSLSSPSTSSIVGCSCGSTDETTDMVACDACNTWFHLMCIGVAKLADLGDEWYCVTCCDMASNVLSPSTLSDRASLIATPNFPRSAAIAGQQLRLSQGQLPVFAQPSSDSPLVRGELRLQQQHTLPNNASALALAPSPTLPSSHIDNDRRSNSGKRSRASRIGWQQAEPGSPLERKSGATPSHKRSISGRANNIGGTSTGPSPSRGRVPTQEQHRYSIVAPPRTPSPHFDLTSTKSRSTSSSARHYRDHSNRDIDDIFSTPSRILQGSASWGAPQWQQASSHNTSMMRHSREDSGLAASHSTPWGLSTPTRFMDTGDLHSDHSEGHGGLPSLVFSSGGLDLADLTWQLQSPSSSTRAATRARQSSSNRRISAARDKTPTPQSSQGKSSCASSSPFPKTPTFQDLSMMTHLHQQPYSHHSHSPQSTSSKNLHRLSQQMTPITANSATTTANSTIRSKSSSQPKARHVSSGDLMAGLGIGLDLEDVLDWA